MLFMLLPTAVPELISGPGSQQHGLHSTASHAGERYVFVAGHRSALMPLPLLLLLLLLCDLLDLTVHQQPPGHRPTHSLVDKPASAHLGPAWNLNDCNKTSC